MILIDILNVLLKILFFGKVGGGVDFMIIYIFIIMCRMKNVCCNKL